MSIGKTFWQESGEDYVRYRPTYPPELALALASAAPSCRLAVDVGCGSGQLSALLAAHFDHVHASDVSANQIANATIHPAVVYREGSAEAIAVEDGTADLVAAGQAAHWFDLALFYREARRIARPGGVIALVTYGVLEVEGPAQTRVDDFYWRDIHPFWPEGREHVENGYRDFDFPFPPVPMPALAIERVWTASHFMSYCGTWSAAKRAAAHGRADILETMAEDLEKLLGPAGTMAIRWPISIRAGYLNHAEEVA